MSETTQNKDNSLLWNIIVWVGIILFVLYGTIDSEDNGTYQTNTVQNPPTKTTPPSINVPKVTPTPKMFYTTGVVNIRTCGSLSCSVITQTNTNTPVNLYYNNVSEIPEWIEINWDINGEEKIGYISKTVLSIIPTITAAPTYPTYHYDSDYKYNYRTGYSGDYDYNYDVSGYGDDYVYGNIDTDDEYVDGYVYNEDGDEVYVSGEWIDYGVMEVYDDDGNWYELEVD